MQGQVIEAILAVSGADGMRDTQTKLAARGIGAHLTDEGGNDQHGQFAIGAFA